MVTLLVGTDDGLVELEGEGTSTTHLGGRSISAVAGGTAGWSTLVDAAEVWHAGFDRTDWQRAAQAPADMRLTCLLGHPEGLLVGTSGAHLLWLDGHGRLEPIDAFDRLSSRTDWYTPWGGPPDIRTLSAGHGGLFANVHVGGIVASPDGGTTWRQSDLDIHTDVHQVVAVANHPDLILAACAEGLAVSHDRGSCWRIDDQGLHATYARAVAVAGDIVVISASTGPRGERSALYRRPVASDGPFERCRAGLPEWFDDNIDTGCLAAAGPIVVASTPSGEVFRSDDQGRTWQRQAGHLPAVRCLALVP